jgi:hypothetical protein
MFIVKSIKGPVYPLQILHIINFQTFKQASTTTLTSTCKPPKQHPTFNITSKSSKILNMKSIISALVLAASATTALAAPYAQYIADWPEQGLQRWRFDFHGVSESNYGQDFLQAIRRHGGTANNWQCYEIGGGMWQFDVSETQTWFGTQAVINAVADVSGLDCYQQGVNPGICRENGF